MNKFKRIIFLSCSALMLLLLNGCGAALLNPKGVIAADERDLLITAVVIMLFIVIPVIIMSFLFAWRYRAANAKAKYDPHLSHNTLLEIVWWAIPCAIILALAIITWISTHRLDPYRPIKSDAKPIIVQAIALEWKWLFIYPEQHIASVNFMQIPVNVPVQFFITSDAPMNSLEIPQLAGQIYAMSGMRTKLSIMASKPGDFRGLSTNYSGAGFSDMNFIVRAGSQEEFNHWVLATQKASMHHPLTLMNYNQLAQPSEKNPVEYFSLTSAPIFDQVIAKYMGPMTMTHEMGDMKAMESLDKRCKLRIRAKRFERYERHESDGSSHDCAID